MGKLSKKTKEYLHYTCASREVAEEVIIFLERDGEGEQGPIGPQGPQGEQGPIGPSGLGGEEIGAPVGFLDPDLVALSIDDASKTLTITPTSGSYTYFVGGKKIVVSSTKTASWAPNHGLYFFYLDENGVLQVSDTFFEEIITKYCFASIVYWDALKNKSIYFADERHGIHMGTSTHLYLHTTRGAQFDRGLRLTGFNVDGGGNSDSDAQFNSESGIIWDEDIRIQIPAQSVFPVFYRLGTVWTAKTADSFSIIYSGQEGFAGPTIAYNLLNAGSWSLQAVDSNKFMLVHIFATNNIQFPLVAILGIQQYSNKTDARNNIKTETQLLGGLPFAEFTPVGSVIFQTNTAYINIPKAQIVSTDTGEDYQDERGDLFRPGTL